MPTIVHCKTIDLVNWSQLWKEHQYHFRNSWLKHFDPLFRQYGWSLKRQWSTVHSWLIASYGLNASYLVQSLNLNMAFRQPASLTFKTLPNCNGKRIPCTHLRGRITLFGEIFKSREDLFHRHFRFGRLFVYRLHMSTRRWRETLGAFFGHPIRVYVVGVCFSRSWGIRVTASVSARIGVFGSGGIGAGRRSLGGVDEGVEARGSSWGRAIPAVEFETIEALEMAPIVTHGDREARARHGARGRAVASGLRTRRNCRCHLGLRSPDYGVRDADGYITDLIA
jgi:hypothetical protein